MSAPLLEVRDLVTAFDTEGGRLVAIDGVSFSVEAGKTLGIVGESGCGKSVTALSVMRLLPKPAGQILAGKVLFEGRNLVDLDPEDMRTVRGGRIGMIFQEPMTALNPVQRIGRQLTEGMRLHGESDADIRNARALELLRQVGIPSPERRMSDYPHNLSGGMRQRVVIAMALAMRPALLIADEPTTALDVTVQAQILDLLRALQKSEGMGLMLITHDLGVIAEACDAVAVMYAGQIVETGPVEAIFARPRHPYTQGLLASVPRLETPSKTQLPTIEGMVPPLASLPAGCRFHNRCPHARDLCAEPAPMERVGAGHDVRCHRWQEIEAPEARP